MDDKSTQRDHLEKNQKLTRRPNPKLQMKCPPAARHLWGYFCELSNAREAGKSLTFSEIKAWSELTGITLDNYELQVIRLLDREFLASRT